MNLDAIRRMHDAVEFDSEAHSYAVNGTTLTPVTRIISETLAKGPAFLGWIAKCTREGKSWRAVAKEEAKIGQAVHRTVENWARRKLGLEPLPEIVCAEASYLCAGLEPWLDSARIEPLFQPETRLHHLELKFGGTTDLPALWHGVPTIFDIKTCRSPEDCWDDWGVQIGAYAEAFRVNGCGEWQGAILRIPKDGGSPNILPLGNDPANFEAFESLVKVYRWKNRSKEKRT